MSLKDHDWMDLAWWFSQFGTCDRLKVGAVLVKDRRILSHGYNGAPRGVKHCDHNMVAADLRERQGVTTGCQRAVHAEMNTIAHAAKHGLSIDGASLYTTDEPCYGCSQAIIAAGIKEVWYAREYRDHAGLNLLYASGVAVFEEPGLRGMPASPVD